MTMSLRATLEALNVGSYFYKVCLECGTQWHQHTGRVHIGARWHGPHGYVGALVCWHACASARGALVGRRVGALVGVLARRHAGACTCWCVSALERRGELEVGGSALNAVWHQKK